MLEAVFFDFDGVIADTEPLHFRAFQRVLQDLALPMTWEQYLEDCVGFDDRDVFRFMMARQGLDLAPATLRALCARKAEAFLALVRDEQPAPYPGAERLLRGLHGRVPLALCSGAVPGDIQPILAAAALDGLFEVMVTADDVEASKPDPTCYRLALERLRARHPGRPLRAAHGVAIEDTPAGIAAAAGAGLRVLAVAHTHPANLLGQATRVVDTLESVTPEDLEALTIESTSGVEPRI